MELFVCNTRTNVVRSLRMTYLLFLFIDLYFVELNLFIPGHWEWYFMKHSGTCKPTLTPM